ncbi:Cyclic diguanosine monophosphate-binding protein [wastewater metagenome]|uniref:Cyclic diguanosine monophosphate-binding protein n=2 Tax=unclassified sequences TaxID=12908 RepID=A0A5B8RBU0_9ZZZZ|nr:PilZ domain-containing protein [Arhodomonas sp. KWT]QEA04842.1 cyclic diguanosine monophosphate-binding protein [uncultured organism]
MSDSDERRRFSRIDMDQPARLEADGAGIPVRVIDISLHGALVRPEAEAAIADTPATLTIPLGDEVVIRMHVTPMHREAGFVGLRCDDLPVESAGHLRRLVELNLGDPELLERELEALAGLGDRTD